MTDCPDCMDDRGWPTGQQGMHADGTPYVCRTCDGKGVLPPPHDAYGSVFDHDGDRFDRTDAVSQALREAYGRAKEAGKLMRRRVRHQNPETP